MSRFFQVYVTDPLTGMADELSRVIEIENRDEVDTRFMRSKLNRIAVIEFDRDERGMVRRHACYFVNKVSTELKLLSGDEVWPDIADWVNVNDVFAQ